MNTIIRNLFLLWVLNVVAFANISEKEVDRYLDVSRAKTLLNSTQYMIVKKFTPSFTSAYLLVERNLSKVSKEKAKILGIKSIKSFVKTQKFVQEFRNTFKKLDSDMYNDIVDFYRTDIGKKLVNAGPPVRDLMATSESLSYINRARNTIISDKKQELLDDIAQEFNIIKLTIKVKKALLLDFSKRDGSGYSEKELEEDLAEMRRTFKVYNKILMHITYLDFNENELEEVLKYAASKAGKEDMKLMYEAMLNYQLVIFKNVDYYANEPIRNAIQKNNKILKEIRGEVE